VDRIMSAEPRDDTEDIAARGGVVGVRLAPDGGDERPPRPWDAILFRLRVVGTTSDARMAARIILTAALILGAAWVAGTAIRVFLASSGFRPW
jgi:hypothetical protein